MRNNNQRVYAEQLRYEEEQKNRQVGAEKKKKSSADDNAAHVLGVVILIILAPIWIPLVLLAKVFDVFVFIFITLPLRVLFSPVTFGLGLRRALRKEIAPTENKF